MDVRIATVREWRAVAKKASYRERDLRNVMLVAIWNAAQPSLSPAAELGEWAREHEAIRLVREVVRRARAVSAGVDGWEPFE